MQTRAIKGGWVTYVGKECTEYGICCAAARIVGIMEHDEKKIIPASFELDGEYGEHDVSVGVPCLVGGEGIEQIYELELHDHELEALHNSCEIIRSSLSEIR